jgi:Na+/H+-dicarboxylate symporter
MVRYNGNKRFKLAKLQNSFILQVLMIILGVASGLSGISYIQNFGIFIAEIFIQMFRCVSLPIIALSIIVTLSGYSSDAMMPSIWKRTMRYTIGTTLFAAIISCILYILIRPHNVSANIVTPKESVINSSSYLKYLQEIIPANIITPFIEYKVMSILLIGVVLGFAMRQIPDEDAKRVVINFFRGLYSIFFLVTKWIVMLLPIGVYGFITSLVVQLKGGVNLGGLSGYLSIIIIANLIQGFIILPLWLQLNGINPFVMMKNMMPALSLAFFSKSSAGTLPVTMDAAISRAKIDPKISRFVLPLCTTINMNGCAAFIFTTVIYLMQNHGIDITTMTFITLIFVATIASIGNAGVPMGCFFLSISLLSSINVPVTLMALILPFYTVIDMIETALNVWSDSCVAKVVDKHEIMNTGDS